MTPHEAVDMLATLRAWKPDEHFSLIAPPVHSLTVEAPAGGDATHGTAASPPATLEELRALVATWTPEDRRDLNDMMTRDSVDRTDAEQVAAAINRYTFQDVTTTPQLPEAPEPVERVTIAEHPDEGDEADERAIEVVKREYGSLDAAGTSWITDVAVHAQRAKCSFSLAPGQPQTVRRFELMRGCVLLASGGFDDHDAVRGILRPILGDTADSKAFHIGALIGSLNATEAALFARLADVVANGTVALAVESDGRFVWEFEDSHAA